MIPRGVSFGAGRVGLGVGGGGVLFVNCIVDASIFPKASRLVASAVGVWCVFGLCVILVVEVFKGTGWMPWH